MTVVNYASKFDDMSMYAHLLVPISEETVDRFINGLNHYISDRMVDHEGEPMECVHDLALKWKIIGIELKEMRKA